MKIVSIAHVASEAGYIAERTRNLLGAIQNARTFEENFGALDSLHEGTFAFLAFHPASDSKVVEYINEGSLGNDAGPKILALFLQGEEPPQAPRELVPGDALYGVKLSLETHPAYELASQFSLDGSRPRLPGLVFFDRLLSPAHSIYIPLDGAKVAQIKTECRRAFEAANACMSTVPSEGNVKKVGIDFDRFAARLIELDIPYRRTGEKGVRAATLFAGAWLKKNAGAIVSAIPKIVGFLAKSKMGNFEV